MRRYFRSLHLAQQFLGFPNVVGVGLGYKKRGEREGPELAVVFLVRKKLPVAALEKEEILPRRVGRVPTDVIEVGEVRFLGRTERLRPAPPGVSIGHFQVTAGTFGAVVRDRATGGLLILSNNHVLANTSDGSDGRAQKGDPILQPGAYDGGTEEDVIGFLERFVPIHRYVKDVDCALASFGVHAANMVLRKLRPRYRLRLEQRGFVNLVDCAVARPLDPGLVTPEILEVGRVAGVRPPELGLAVKKSGRTSGLTTGRVVAVRVALNVTMSHGADVVHFREQMLAELKSAPGDSGSLVLDLENRAVGLLFAGSQEYSVFNPIQPVLERLGVELV